MGEDQDPGVGKPQRDDAGYRSAFRHLHLGTQLAGCLLICLWGGNWLDEKVGWSPVFTLVGAVLGIVLGIGVVIRAVGGSGKT